VASTGTARASPASTTRRFPSLSDRTLPVAHADEPLVYRCQQGAQSSVWSSSASCSSTERSRTPCASRELSYRCQRPGAVRVL
jgi:hypothetical protein